MAQDRTEPKGPDLSRGVPLTELSDGGMLVGHLAEDEVLLVRRGDVVFALDAHCTHYHGPLVDGLVVGETVRCPWHHACFDITTGEAVRAPAFSPLSCWTVEQRDGKVFVTGKKAVPAKAPAIGHARPDAPRRIVIVGGGAAGFAAAEMLRREGYDGSLTMLSDDDAAPVDRPNLSKDYLAGSAPEDWVPLRPEAWYGENHLDLRLRTSVTGLDLAAREVALGDGGRIPYDRLLLATGAEPVRLPVPGADQPHVHMLRSLSDCRAIITAAEGARRVAIIGASFIGLEVAASMRARKLEVHVIAPESQPLVRVFGPELGEFIRALHEQNGVVFHLENSATAIGPKQVTLKSGSGIDVDLVVVGIGVRPRLALAEQAGLALDRGIAVNAYLETSAPGVYAAGDIARWPDPASGERIRVEHWVVATCQGQAVARNMLGAQARYEDVPFFWSQHYDVPINYVGHAEAWDTIDIEGDIAGKDCLLRYQRGRRTLAVASIYRDVASLEAELAMERCAAA
jgi:NADPH-dependent 2,4-dienoyl-CoA reductase/sulfur reductase-like enzyme/nitrite reductase/ring-hydroxylating ferredoxin subunit